MTFTFHFLPNDKVIVAAPLPGRRLAVIKNVSARYTTISLMAKCSFTSDVDVVAVAVDGAE